MSDYARRLSNETTICKCGCGTVIPKYDKKGREKNYVKGHQRTGKPFSVCNMRNFTKEQLEETKLCECGCGQEILKYDKNKGTERRFVNGHQTKGENHPMIGRQHSEETKAEYSRVRKGRVNPEHVREQTRQRNLENWQDPEYREKMCNILNENSQKIAADPKYREMLSERMKETMLERWRDPRFRKKIFNSVIVKPNKAELFLQSLIDNLYPNEWKYVGDGSIWINGKNPDFMCINGKKLLIELFGDYWHQGEDPQDRIDVFEPYGYKTLVIWENELNNKNKTAKKIIYFVETN